MNKGNEYDIEAGTKQRSSRNKYRRNNRCSRFLLKAIMAFMIVAVYIGYFIAISRSSPLLGNYPEFDVHHVTNSPSTGKSFRLNIIFKRG